MVVMGPRTWSVTLATACGAAPRGARNRIATSTMNAPPLIALPMLCDRPLTLVPRPLSAVTAMMRPQANTPVETSGNRCSRCTYSPNTTEMKALDAVYCSQVSQPFRKPVPGPKARAEML